MTTLSTTATNEGTYVITCTFKDADGTAVVPNALTWDLTDSEDNIINNRSDVTVSPAVTVTIVLSDADLDYADSSKRIFSIKGTYNSATYGNDLPIREQAKFTVDQWY